MSNAVFTPPSGLKFDNAMSPEFKTLIQRAAGGNEVRIGLMAYPLWTFTLSFEFLRNMAASNELKPLGGFFLQRRGSLDSFLYSEPSDNSVTDYQFGTGDGTTTQFQLNRSYGGFVEPVMNVNALTNIKIAGSATSAYTINSSGLVTFSVAPSAGQSLTWTGTYYYRCRFLNDATEFSQFMKDLWENKKLQFIGSTLNKL